MADSETDWKHVGLKVERSQYKDWEDYLEESDKGSMSQLIRTAVEAYGGGPNVAEGGSRDGNPQGAWNDQRVGELLQAVENMAHRLNRLETEVNEATLTMHEANTDRDLTPDVYEALPTGRTNARTAAQLANEIESQPQSVAVTLARLEHNTNVVERIETTEKEHPEAAETAGETYWYREE